MRRFVTGLALAAALIAFAAAQQKRRVAVLDFDYATVHSDVTSIYGAEQDIGKGVADLIVGKLVASGEYSVVERKALDKVLAEQNFSNSDRADPNSAAKIGRVLGADAIIMGSITKFGRDDTSKTPIEAGLFGLSGLMGVKRYEAKAVVGISARMVDTETAEVFVAAQGEGKSSRAGTSVFGVGGGAADVKNKSLAATILGEATNAAVDQLCWQFDSTARKLPAKAAVINGVVADAMGGVVVLNVGSHAGLRIGDRLQLRRIAREVSDPLTGAVLKNIEDMVGDVIILEVDEKSATGQYRGSTPAQVGDTVHNRARTLKPLTNEELLGLAKAGFDEESLIKVVEANDIALDLSDNVLLGLKNGGVSEKVISIALASKAKKLSPATAGTDSDALEVGVYMMRHDKPTPVDPEIVDFRQGWGKISGTVKGPHSLTQVTGAVILVVRCAEGVAASEYQLVKLDETGGRREFRAATVRMNHASTDNERNKIPIQFVNIASHTYRLVLSGLKRGEYGLLPPGANASVTLRSASKVYTFGVRQ